MALLVSVAVACAGATIEPPLTAAPTVETGKATASPTAEPAATIREGVWVEVDVEEGCLAVAVYEPHGTSGNCLSDGFVGYVTEGPETAEGRLWRIAGQGWAPEENLRFHHEGGFPYPARLDLVDAGLIAYVGDDSDVWLINADGSQPRRLFDIEAALGLGARAGEIAWSPNGDAIAVSAFNWLIDDTATKGIGKRVFTVVVADLSGAVVATIPDARLSSWSPDGTHLALLAELMDQAGVEPVCAFSNSAFVGVFDLRTAETAPVTPRGCYFDGPEWSPDGVNLLYTRDGDIYMYALSEAREHLVKANGEDDWYWTVTWAPDSFRFSAFHHFVSDDTSLGAYEVFDLEAENPLVSFAEPRGGCPREATAGAWQTHWTADGRYMLYNEPCGEPDFSGVWIGDVATGDTVRIPVEGAGRASPSPNSRHLVFHTAGSGSGNLLWVTNVDGSNLTLLVEGGAPVWQP